MNIFNCCAVAVLLVVVLLPIVGPVLAAEVSTKQESEHFLLRWQGDEDRLSGPAYMVFSGSKK
jgi:hypothetical protein